MACLPTALLPPPVPPLGTHPPVLLSHQEHIALARPPSGL